MKLKQFAETANKSIEDIISDLERAGIHGKTADSEFTSDDMKTLLNARISGRVQQVEEGTFKVASNVDRQKSEYEITVSTRGGRRLAPRHLETPPLESVEQADEPSDDAPGEMPPANALDAQPAAAEEAGVDETAVEPEPIETADADNEAARPPAIKAAEPDIHKKAPASKESEGDAGARKGAKQRRSSRRSEKGFQREKLRVPEGKSRLRRERTKKAKPRFSDQEHNQHAFTQPLARKNLKVTVAESNQLSDLAKAMSVKTTVLTTKLFELTGTLHQINAPIDKDTAYLLVEEIGHTPVEVSTSDLESEILIAQEEKRESVARHAVVAVMGHVDHGKTTLLDSIRSTKVAAGEKGGITQHIGAYVVSTDKGKITFFDTPGHEAFTKMRIRGAEATDIVVLVVAADDGVKPQTVEAISHAKAAKVPIIIAINKMDKEKADPQRVLRELTEHEIVAESLGGDVQVVEISALRQHGIDALLELIGLESEILELKAPDHGPASGVVIEAHVDRGRGKVVTVLVQKGQLKIKDVITAGTQWGKIRALADAQGKRVKSALPSTPIEIEGFKDLPLVGDEFLCVADERVAQQLVEFRAGKNKTGVRAPTAVRFGADEPRVLNAIIKADVQGSAEALASALEDLGTDEVNVKVIQSMVGGVSQSDVDLAVASDAMIIAFNAKADATARSSIAESQVKVIYANVIYHALDEVAAAIESMSMPKMVEEIIAKVKVREVFNLSRIGTVAGSYVEDGTVRNNAQVRVVRNNIVVHEGMINSLKRFARDVAEVKAGNECGIQIKNFNDVIHEDLLEVYQVVEMS